MLFVKAELFICESNLLSTGCIASLPCMDCLVEGVRCFLRLLVEFIRTDIHFQKVFSLM